MLAAKKSTHLKRVSFEKTKSEIEFPDLLAVQIEAFQSFIQENIPEDEAKSLQDKIQQLTDKYVLSITDISKKKEDDIMKI